MTWDPDELMEPVGGFDGGGEMQSDIVIHECPPNGSGLMPCCGRTPFERPAERMTEDPKMVTCRAVAARLAANAAPGNTPISDEAVEAYRRAASTGRTAGLLGKEYTRRGLAAARPLLVSAEAERRDPKHGTYGEMMAEIERLREVVAAMDRELEEARDEWASEVEGLRAELAETTRFKDVLHGVVRTVARIVHRSPNDDGGYLYADVPAMVERELAEARRQLAEADDAHVSYAPGYLKGPEGDEYVRLLSPYMGETIRTLDCEHGVMGDHYFVEDTEWGVNHHYCPGRRHTAAAVSGEHQDATEDAQ